NEFLQLAARKNRKITTEIGLLVERLPTKLTLGVTGTKGKSTTTTLLGKMLEGWQPLPEGKRPPRSLRSAVIDLWEPTDRRVFVGGNLGGSLLPRLGEITASDFVVLELSSFMLHHLGRQQQWSPHVAVVTMIDEDHLAWHGDAATYHHDKQHLVRHQTERDFAVLPSFNKPGRGFKEHTPATVVEYGKRANLPEAFAPNLPGKHNRLNERAAFAAAKLMGVYIDQAEAKTRDFAGLPHRMQLVHERNGVRYFDDSIATIPAAAAVACCSFPVGTVLQIVGGSDKELTTDEMAKVLAERCKAVLCIGATGPALAEQIGSKAIHCGTLEVAMQHAAKHATSGDVVLLSTGYASYDQFPNFQERGKRFAELARALRIEDR
ncbi:MAG: UDP-N-acetylmuramoyl-L-alanine--D-glutamate ligase, partial [Planctomycetota bacterium]